MNTLTEAKNIYLSDFGRFEKQLRTREGPLHRLRKAALQSFVELGFPTPRTEDWKFTNLASLAKIPFRTASVGVADRLPALDIDSLALPLGQAHRLVFVDGLYREQLSRVGQLPKGVVISSLARMLEMHPDWADRYLGSVSDYRDVPFSALNTAFLADGACVLVPEGQVVDAPIHLVFLTTASDEGYVAHPRNVLSIASNAHATVVEQYQGIRERSSFTNAVTEVTLGERAVVDHYKIQRESIEAFHIATLQVRQRQASTFSTHGITLGGGLVRNEVRVHLDGAHCETTVNGLYLASGRQHVDNHTVIDHAQPNCASHELFKGILDGRARGVFNGKIFVRQDAQKTDAKQTNQTLLLSEEAVIDTKPQLEIYADDVKCTHGATVGQLDPRQIFYLRSRGIHESQARKLLTFAFANDLVGRIRVDPLRAELEDYLLDRQQLAKAPGQEGP